MVHAGYLALHDYLKPGCGHFNLLHLQWSLSLSTGQRNGNGGSRASRKTARLRKGSSDRWNLNLKLMRRVWWPAVLSLLMKAEGNRSVHGPNRCSLIRAPNACYGAGTLMTFKETVLVTEGGRLQNNFYLSVGEIKEKLNGFVLKSHLIIRYLGASLRWWVFS